MSRLVDIGISIRTSDKDENPWYARLMASLEKYMVGLPVEILVESAPELTKVEKRLRIFRRSSAKYLCLHGDTKIATPAGEIPIKEMVGKKDLWVYSLADVGAKRTLTLKPVRAAKKTRVNAEMVRVRFKWRTGASLSGRIAYGEVICTPDHQFLMLSGEYKEAQYLCPSDRLEPFYRVRQESGAIGWHIRLFNCQERYKESRFVFEQVHGLVLNSRDIIHHINHDPFQNWPLTNLMRISDKEHRQYHASVDAMNPDRAAKLSQSLQRFYAKNGKPQQGEINRRVWNNMSSEQQEEKLQKMFIGLESAKLDGRLSQRSISGWETRRKNGNDRHSEELKKKRSEILRQQYANGMRTPPSLRSDVKKKISESKRKKSALREMAASNHEVISVELVDNADAYCLEVPDTHNFVANGVFVHNCLLEDDTEILHENWLVRMVSHMAVLDRMAILNPQETRQSLSDSTAEELLKDEVQELTNVAGFCMLVDRESGVEPDVRVQTMDDLWMSLQARANGWRIGRSKGSLIRHSKAPWADDNLAPWEQTDRSRWGNGHSYYERNQHEAKRRLEAKLIVEIFGDVARLALPKELLPWADPLHPDFGMAWDRGQPVEYKSLTSCYEVPLEGLKIGGTI